MGKLFLSILVLASIVCNNAVAVHGQETLEDVKFDDFLRTNVDLVSFEGKNAAQTLTVALKERPPAEVVLYYQAPNTKFDKCAMTFTPDNFDKPQNLQIVEIPFMNQSPGPIDVPIRFTSYSMDRNSQFHNRHHRVNSKRLPASNGLCEVNGDPHYKPFDQNDILHYQGEGDFYLVKSNALTIQSRQVKCVQQATCVNMIAVRYGKSSFVIDANGEDPGTSVKQVSTELEGVVISRIRSETSVIIEVAFNAGSSMVINIHSTGAHRIMNVSMKLSHHFRGKVNGLCGRFEGNAENRFTGPNGEKHDAQIIMDQSRKDWANTSPNFNGSPLFRFGEQWRVPEGDNIFKCKNACPGAPNPETPVDEPVAECKIPSPPTNVLSTTQSQPIVTTTSTQSQSINTAASSIFTTVSRSQTVTATGTQTQTIGTTATGPIIATVPAGRPIGTTLTGSQTLSTIATLPIGTTSGQPINTIATAVQPIGTTTRGLPITTTAAPGQPPITVVTRGLSLTTTVAANLPIRTPVTPEKPLIAIFPVSSSTAGQIFTSSESTATIAPASETSPASSVPSELPKPIVKLPVPAGYSRVLEPPRYVDEPTVAPPSTLPPAPRSEVDKAKEECNRRISPIDQCNVNIKRYIDSCQADIEAQLNPEVVFSSHRFSYTTLCAQIIIDQIKDTSKPDVSRRALESAKNHHFGNIRCDTECLQCSAQGCLECKNKDKFEVQAGKCAPIVNKVVIDGTYFSPDPVIRALKPEEIAPEGVDPATVTVADGVDAVSNDKSLVESDSIGDALAKDPLKILRDLINNKNLKDAISKNVTKLQSAASTVHISSAMILAGVISYLVLM